MYQYTDCYLDNIFLVNGYSFVKSDHEDYAEILDVDGLHELMMNMEVGSILKLGEPFFFKHTEHGWVQLSEQELAREVA